MKRSQGFKRFEKLPALEEVPGEGRQGRFRRLRERQASLQAAGRAAAPSLSSFDHAGLRWLPYDEFLRSEFWQRIRAKCRVAANFKCQRCGSSRKLQVHHTTYEIRGREHENLDKLEVLCESCHRAEHHLA